MDFAEVRPRKIEIGDARERAKGGRYGRALKSSPSFHLVILLPPLKTPPWTPAALRAKPWSVCLTFRLATYPFKHSRLVTPHWPPCNAQHFAASRPWRTRLCLSPVGSQSPQVPCSLCPKSHEEFDRQQEQHPQRCGGETSTGVFPPGCCLASGKGLLLPLETQGQCASSKGVPR